jgi:hypothetical protein
MNDPKIIRVFEQHDPRRHESAECRRRVRAEAEFLDEVIRAGALPAEV